jgi:hypothetical protein
MTAAGASSLLVLLRGLEGHALAVDAQKALQAAYAWLSLQGEQFYVEDKNTCYTLYSLEKVGDLAGIEAFGQEAWYARGAEVLIRLQRKDGGWGSHSDTALALLFLTRATRTLRASAAPPVLSGAKGNGMRSGDLVYVDLLDGFISAAALLGHIRRERSSALLPLAEQAVHSYALDFEYELVPHLLGLWSRPDNVSRFARGELERITGLSSTKKEAFLAWYGECHEVLELETDPGIDAGELADALGRIESVRLRCRIVALIGRRGHRELAGRLIEELATPSAVYRLCIHGALSLFFPAPESAPDGDDDSAWERVAAGWRAAWQSHLASETR